MERSRAALALLASVFLLVNLVNALHKGGDFGVYVEAATRLTSGASLYAGSAATVGFVGPPAQALLFVPFAPVAAWDARAARLTWYGLNLCLLWYALATWSRVLTGDRVPAAAGPPRAFGESSRDALLALAGVAYPLQTQFEQQNLNIVLLALAACAADALRRDRRSAAGLAIGAAVALKVYPALALPWLAARRSWRVLCVAIGVAIALSLAPILLRGTSGFLHDVDTWRDIASLGWPLRRANQSIVAMWGRYLAGEDETGFPFATWDMPSVIACSVVTTAVLVLPLLVAAAGRRSSSSRLAEELACVNAVAALASPIAWEHYWVAWFPVLLALRVRARDERSRGARLAFWVGALLISGLSRPIVGWQGGRVVRAWSLMTWGGLVTCGSLTYFLLRDRRISRRAALQESASRLEEHGDGLHPRS